MATIGDGLVRLILALVLLCIVMYYYVSFFISVKSIY